MQVMAHSLMIRIVLKKRRRKKCRKGTIGKAFLMYLQMKHDVRNE